MKTKYDHMTPILKKMSVGDSLSDKEIKDALAFYTDLELKLAVLCPIYELQWREALREKMSLEDYHRARVGRSRK